MGKWQGREKGERARKAALKGEKQKLVDSVLGGESPKTCEKGPMR